MCFDLHLSNTPNLFFYEEKNIQMIYFLEMHTMPGWCWVWGCYLSSNIWWRIPLYLYRNDNNFKMYYSFSCKVAQFNYHRKAKQKYCFALTEKKKKIKIGITVLPWAMLYCKYRNIHAAVNLTCHTVSGYFCLLTIVNIMISQAL